MQPEGEVAAKLPWHRNWKIMVPLALFASFGACGTCIGAFVWGAFSMVKSADVYTAAVAKAREDARVVAALGVPLAEGLVPSGEVKITDDQGHADLTIPVTGPNGKGLLHLVADRHEGQWRYLELQVAVEGASAPIDLLLPAQ